MRDKILFAAVLLFVLSSISVLALGLDTKETIDVFIDLVAILIGVALTIYIVIILKSFTGSLRKSFDYMAFGILFQILALLEHSLRDLKVYSASAILGIDIHHILMAIGIVFFGIATYNLNKMMSELKKKG